MCSHVDVVAGDVEEAQVPRLFRNQRAEVPALLEPYVSWAATRTMLNVCKRCGDVLEQLADSVRVFANREPSNPGRAADS